MFLISLSFIGKRELFMDVSDQIERFRDFLNTHYSQLLHKAVQSGKFSLVLDFSLLAQHDVDLAESVLQDPFDVLRSAELALDQFDFPSKSTVQRIRFKNLPDLQKVKIGEIRSSHLGFFLAIEGIVRQASDVRPQVTNAKFECIGCGNTLSILQVEQKFKEPSRCTCGWQGKFRLLSKDLIDVQHLKIEEPPDSLEGGEQPKRISVLLKEDLVEPRMEKRTVPGSRILVSGFVREVAIPLKTGAQSVRFDLLLEANNIETVEEDFYDIELTDEDKEKIQLFSQDKQAFEKLSRSIAPSIWGHEKIKEALVLQLFSGYRKVRGDNTVTRGDIHILLVGDPGAGKSQILQFISKVAPKARFVSGKGSSGAGLTATVVKDEFLRGWALEAGALALANKGIAVVDELDKMTPEDRDALHEALEQQTITISKANVQATLSAQTTLLAAANPKLGRFDPYSPLAGQIDLPSTLINRFDLIFPIRDIPSTEHDTKIALHVLEEAHKPETYSGDVSEHFLKKYIAYAKQTIKPTLTKSAVNEIKDFYVSLRNSSQNEEGGIKAIPISARQLEGLIRLAEASAKIRLDTKVNKDDARRAIELLRYCLMQVGFDPETGQIDMDRMSTGIGASARGRIMTLRDVIHSFDVKGMKNIPLDELYAEAALKNIDQHKVDEALEQLNRAGEVFYPKRGFVSLVK